LRYQTKSEWGVVVKLVYRINKTREVLEVPGQKGKIVGTVNGKREALSRT